MKPLTIPVKSGIKQLIVNNRLSSIPTLILIFLFSNSCFAQNEAWYIVLIMKTIQDRKYGIMLQSAIDYAGLTDKIRVWFYPEDFGIPFAQPTQTFTAQRQQIVQTKGKYSYNKSSKVRHNSRCTYFSCGNCMPTNEQLGRACGKCGG